MKNNPKKTNIVRRPPAFGWLVLLLSLILPVAARAVVPYVVITDYGAIGDGNIANASVNATALTNALATGKTVKIPYAAAGYHFGTNQITVGTGQIIEGESQVLLKSTATTSLFRMTGY